jgi:dihydroxyacetone kinase-like predicted kinase
MRTRTGSVTLVVRDGVTPAGRVRAGDAIGFAGNDPVPSDPDPLTVALSVAEALGDGEVLTVLTGADAPAAEIDALEHALAERFPGLSVEMRDGGQPVHRYLFALE